MFILTNIFVYTNSSIYLNTYYHPKMLQKQSIIHTDIMLRITIFYLLKWYISYLNLRVHIKENCLFNLMGCIVGSSIHISSYDLVMYRVSQQTYFPIDVSPDIFCKYYNTTQFLQYFCSLIFSFWNIIIYFKFLWKL